MLKTSFYNETSNLKPLAKQIHKIINKTIPDINLPLNSGANFENINKIYENLNAMSRNSADSVKVDPEFRKYLTNIHEDLIHLKVLFEHNQYNIPTINSDKFHRKLDLVIEFIKTFNLFTKTISIDQINNFFINILEFSAYLININTYIFSNELIISNFQNKSNEQIIIIFNKSEDINISEIKNIIDFIEYTLEVSFLGTYDFINVDVDSGCPTLEVIITVAIQNPSISVALLSLVGYIFYCIFVNDPKKYLNAVKEIIEIAEKAEDKELERLKEASKEDKFYKDNYIKIQEKFNIIKSNGINTAIEMVNKSQKKSIDYKNFSSLIGKVTHLFKNTGKPELLEESKEENE